MEHGLKCERGNSSKYEICEPFYHVCFSRSTPNFVETKQNFGRGGKNTAKTDWDCRKILLYARWWFQGLFIFTPTWGNESNLTNMFQISRNHQRDTLPAIRRKKITAYQLLTRWFRLRFRASAPWWPTAPWRRQRRRQHYHHQSSPSITLTHV